MQTSKTHVKITGKARIPITPLNYLLTFTAYKKSGAKDGIRTRDPWYHKPVL